MTLSLFQVESIAQNLNFRDISMASGGNDQDKSPNCNSCPTMLLMDTSVNSIDWDWELSVQEVI